jgi:hypothetical protein
MTLDQLKTLSDTYGNDEAFKADIEVRRAYWACLGRTGRRMHTPLPERYTVGLCEWCGALWSPARQEWGRGSPDGVWNAIGPDCPSPPPIPGSLADAAEELRKKVAEKGWDPHIVAIHSELFLTHISTGYVEDSARDRFIIFATTLLREKTP